LSDIYGVSLDIISAIRNTKNEEFLKEIISHDFKITEKEFLSNMSMWGSASGFNA
jgi:hypothetical protein